MGVKRGPGLEWAESCWGRFWPWYWFRALETEGRALGNPHSTLASPHSPHSLAGTPGFSQVHRFQESRGQLLLVP